MVSRLSLSLYLYIYIYMTVKGGVRDWPIEGCFSLENRQEEVEESTTAMESSKNHH